MKEWNLPSQKVVTERRPGQSDRETFLEHETKRRIQAEADLVKALDMLETVKTLIVNTNNKAVEVNTFLKQYE